MVTMTKVNTYSATEVDKSVLELAEAALHAIERINTPRLAAMGYEDAAVAIGEARGFLDRLVFEQHRFLSEK